MNLTTELYSLSERVQQLKDQITTEESTKMALIAPLFQTLGYDIFNPTEFCPEYTADVGIKKGEKVDYAILLNGHPIILIEAKSVNRKLEKQDSQLFRYFSTTNARFAILTNGIVYKFYTDLSEKNRMDREPFYELNMLNLTEDDINTLSQFAKSNFNEEDILYNASLLKYANIFRLELERQFSNPSDEFVRFFLKEHYKGTKTQNVVDKFKPVLKKSINDYLDEITKERMTSLVNNTGYVSTPTPASPELSELELDAVMKIKTLLNNLVDMEEITYKQTDSYLAILYNGNTRKWIAPVIITDSKITLILPDENKNECRYKLDSIQELDSYGEQLNFVLNNYLNPPKIESISTDYIFTKWGKYPRPDHYVPFLKYGLPSDEKHTS